MPLIIKLSKDEFILAIFALVMIAAARSMITNKKHTNKAATNSESVPLIIRNIAIAFLTGIVTGFVGAGGGFLIIPALVTLMGVHMAMAIGTSLLIISINSLSGFISVALRQQNMPWAMLITMVIIAGSGAILSAGWSSKIPQKKLKAAFGWFVLTMGCVILVQQLI